MGHRLTDEELERRFGLRIREDGVVESKGETGSAATCALLVGLIVGAGIGLGELLRLIF